MNLIGIALIIVASAFFLATCGWILQIVLAYITIKVRDGGKDGMKYERTPIKVRKTRRTI